MSENASFHFVTVVWGRAYTRNYLDLILPTQLSPANLPAMAGTPGTVYKVYTTTEDAAVIRADARFAAVGRHVRTEIIEFARAPAGLGFEAMIEQHRRAIVEANVSQAAFVALSPDAIFADGCFAALRRLHQEGKRLVFVVGLRSELQSFADEVNVLAPADAAGVITLPPRLLMRIALAHLHPISESLFWDSPEFSAHPSHLYWWARKESPRALCAYCFHLHPLMIDPADKTLVPESSIDDDYIHTACPDPATHHVITDSDELACVELSGLGNRMGLHGPEHATVATVAEWANNFCNDTHLQIVNHPILLHDGPGLPADAIAGLPATDVVKKVVRRTHSLIRIEKLIKVLSPCLRWRGWLCEQDWRGRSLRLRRTNKDAVRGFAIQLDACWPTDLIVIHGTVFGEHDLRARIEISGLPAREVVAPRGHFRWVYPAPFAYGVQVRITVPDATRESNLMVGRVTTWRTVIHHLREKIRPPRPNPLWLQWEGLTRENIARPGTKLRLIPHWGVKSIRCEFEESNLDSTPNGKRHLVRHLLTDAGPDGFIELSLPGPCRWLSVECEESASWRAFKDSVQFVHTIARTLFTPASWARLRRRLFSVQPPDEPGSHTPPNQLQP